MIKLIRFSALFILIALFASCSNSPEILNVKYNLGELSNGVIQADLSGVVTNGIEIPTERQTASGNFDISFEVKGSKGQNYFYKIYYQNESYKFPEIADTAQNYNAFADENFYGSWNDPSIGFKKVPAIDFTINESIKIIGNPRDEKKYYGIPFQKTYYSEEDIQAVGKNIRETQDWFAAIVSKAEKNKLSIEEQLLFDAKWVLKNETRGEHENNRWKRNPRMGTYSLMVVVTTEEELAKIPKHIQFINELSDSGIFVSPYYFFKYKINPDSFPDTKVFIDSSFVRVQASMDVAGGICANPLEYPSSEKMPDEKACGWNKDLFNNAHFGQFFSSLNKNFHLNTIPLIQDVNDSSYTKDEYDSAIKKYSEKQFKKDYIRSTENPCKYVRYNENKKAIEIVNPGNDKLADAHKVNMGIKTRIGFTYGKITAKIKFPELINKHNVWNGLTNAFWLIYQDEQEWNNRRVCKTGYSKKGETINDAPRISQTNYSEIDFEIVKTSPKWPIGYYKGRINEKDESQSDDIIVGCTNWDLTCKDCKTYTWGIDTVEYENKTFETMRWDSHYQALTTRTAAKDNDLFKSPYYYYQFEWTPNHIIWRIGPEKDKLSVVGYMNSDITSIPNNQMIAVITQEYHLSEWWPPITFKQEFIPFPKNDIIGEVYELTIE
ncbi:MAG: hypothetical protein H0V01_03590 [Bacteroidetes bacterium]|nr:hypothetical protein [Bacteroidota bacterium]HET6245529.1 hypothetical protein [Bacteroidia bacterium]